MTKKWGLFLCNCRQTGLIDPERLDFPTPFVQWADQPEQALHEFTGLVAQEQLDRVLISCCTAPSFFHTYFASSFSLPPKLYFLNLNERCFWIHNPVSTDTLTKATRLIRATIQAAEVQSKLTYNFVQVRNRLLIITDMPEQGQRLAEQISAVVQPVFVLGPDTPPVENLLPWPTHRGHLQEIKGRLGDFRVMLEEDTGGRDLVADQVVLLFRGTPPLVKPRTGCYLSSNPTPADLEQIAEQIRQHIGEFLKPVHIDYQEDLCAGGAASQEACGRCMPACPYTAISRQERNSLRMHVDHLTCEGCGACVSACPTSALQFTEPSSQELYTRLAALLTPLTEQRNGEERLVVLFHCSEKGARTLEIAGQQSFSYPAQVLPIEVPCLRYVSEANMLAAFRLGAAGVGFLGCETCAHGERELFYQNYDFSRLTLEAFGFGAERLRLITTEEGKESAALTTLTHFAETVPAAPVRWDGQPALRHSGNREVINEVIKTFIEQGGCEPGRRTFHASYPFAFAEVQAAGCTLCRSCVNVCPVHAFRFEQRTFALQYKHLDCVACGLCETVCPEQVITLHREIYFEQEALEYQTVVQDEMITCSRCGKPYINKKALEMVESKVLSLESLLDTFTGIRRTLLRMCPDCRAVTAMLEVQKGWEP